MGKPNKAKPETSKAKGGNDDAKGAGGKEKKGGSSVKVLHFSFQIYDFFDYFVKSVQSN